MHLLQKQVVHEPTAADQPKSTPEKPAQAAEIIVEEEKPTEPTSTARNLSASFGKLAAEPSAAALPVPAQITEPEEDASADSPVNSAEAGAKPQRDETQVRVATAAPAGPAAQVLLLGAWGRGAEQGPKTVFGAESSPPSFGAQSRPQSASDGSTPPRVGQSTPVGKVSHAVPFLS